MEHQSKNTSGMEREFAERMLAHLPFDPSEEQMLLVAGLSRFVLDDDPHTLFLLRGFAGTGKTSLVGALVRTLGDVGMKAVLMAPTGRAAHVMGDYARHAAFTIHRRIYRQQRYGSEAFSLAENKHTDTLFVVDEASMIADGSGDTVFGSGNLLDDLMTYVYSGTRCRLLLVGDSAQLPPVGQEESPAMNVARLQTYGMRVYEMALRVPARQQMQSGIVANATTLRQAIEAGPAEAPQLRLNGMTDIRAVAGEDLLETVGDCYDRDGTEQTLIITRSNWRAAQFNAGVRNQILYREDELSTGDLLIVAKNNYFWTRGYDGIDFIANGDVATVSRVRGEVETRYGLRFATVILQLPDHNDTEVEAKVVLDGLLGESPALTRTQTERMFNELMAEQTGDRNRRLRALKDDPYFNALQVKFGYAVTCHKAQGGQWRNVLIDMGGIAREATTTIDYHRWLYTALTRARRNVFLINYFPESEP